MFARKLIRPCGIITLEDIDNEVRAAVKLGENTVANIVSIIKHGKLPDSPYYFIDMEFCDLNLESYIYRKWPPNMTELVPAFEEIDKLEPTKKFSQTLSILSEIIDGVVFIHSRGEIHRDLKPQNGKALIG